MYVFVCTGINRELLCFKTTSHFESETDISRVYNYYENNYHQYYHFQYKISNEGYIAKKFEFRTYLVYERCV